MYCGKCGNPIANGAHFCARCGTKVLAQGTPAQPEHARAEANAFQQHPNPQAPNAHSQIPSQPQPAAHAQQQPNAPGSNRGRDSKFGCVTIVMYFVIVFLCGGGAGIAFKNGLPIVGIPMMVLGVLVFGAWLVAWIVRVRR